MIFRGVKVKQVKLPDMIRGFATPWAIYVDALKWARLGEVERSALLEHEYQHVRDMRRFHVLFFITYPIFLPFGRWFNPWELRAECIEWSIRAGQKPAALLQLLRSEK